MERDEIERECGGEKATAERKMEGKRQRDRERKINEKEIGDGDTLEADAGTEREREVSDFMFRLIL